MKYKYQIIFFIFLVSLAISIFLSATDVPPICEEHCDFVRASKYAETFGVKNSIYGIIIFSFLSLVASFQIKSPSVKKRLLINYAVTIGTVIAGYFIYLQVFVLNAYCKYCLVVDIAMLVAFGLIFTDDN